MSLLVFNASLDKEASIVQNVIKDGLLEGVLDWMRSEGFLKGNY